MIRDYLNKEKKIVKSSSWLKGLEEDHEGSGCRVRGSTSVGGCLHSALCW